MTNDELLQLFEALPDAILVIDQAGVVVAANLEAEVLVGYPRAELVGKGVEELMPARFRAAHPGQRARFPGTRTMGAPLNLVVLRKDGAEVPVDIALRTLATGQLTLCSLRNVEERRAAAARLKTSESQLHAVLDAALDAIIILGSDGVVSKFNPAAERLFGFAASAVVGHPMVDLIIPPALRERHRQGFARYLATREPSILGRRVESRALRADGTEFPIELSILRVGTGEPPVFTGFIRDLTERNRLQAELIQSQKMETVGQLAAGVAHDFNNLLTVINSAVEFAEQKFTGGERADEELEAIREAAAQGAALTAQLLAYSRRQVRNPVLLELNPALTRIEGLLRRILSQRSRLTLVLAPSLPSITVDPGQLEQVVLNLVVNARDAMPEGGSLTITTHEVLTAPEADHLPPGRWVQLTVSDTGTGMDEATVAKMFDPFFTTKAPGKGTGLGLSTVHGILKQSGAEVRVDSKPGRGTTFRIYFPAAQPGAQGPAPAPR